MEISYTTRTNDRYPETGVGRASDSAIASSHANRQLPLPIQSFDISTMTAERFESRFAWNKAVVFTDVAHPQLVEQLWNDPDAIVDTSQKLVEKQCVRTTVRFAVGAERYVVKRHVERSWRHFAKQLVSRSRAEKCWSDTWYLINSGYPTPRPVAYRENRLGSLRGNSYYVYEYIHGQTFKELATGLKNQRLLRQLVNQLTEIWMQHHLLGINLSDGHPANFIVDATGKMWVIDLDKLVYLPKSVDNLEALRATFESTMQGVIGDAGILQYGRNAFEAKFSQLNFTAAA